MKETADWGRWVRLQLWVQNFKAAGDLRMQNRLFARQLEGPNIY